MRTSNSRPGVQSAALPSDFFLPREKCALDILSLGEVMLRFDPGVGRVHTARQFSASEGGGEYNVARGFCRAFGLRASVVTALVDNPIGRLIEDLILGGGVHTGNILWKQDDGVGRLARNGLNFTERGYGPRPALGCSDRGHTAISQLGVDEVDFAKIFSQGVRLLHTGGIFAALGESTSAVAEKAMSEARAQGVRISYDLNYRPSLWKGIGGEARAAKVNAQLVQHADFLFGNEEDFSAALGFEIESDLDEIDPHAYAKLMREVAREYPNLRVIATSLRVAPTASSNQWGGLLYNTQRDEIAYMPPQETAIFDRVGGGDSFASGVLYALLNSWSLERSLSCGVAHGALAMSTPGDTSMASLPEIERLMAGGNARIQR